MSRQDARSIYLTDEVVDKLAEVYGKTIEAVQKAALSEKLKNKNYSGDPMSGSVEINRFANAKVNPLGTARTAGAGNKLKNSGKVTIKVDTDKEIVEEVAKKDLDLHSADQIAEQRQKNHVLRMAADLDRTFFGVMENAGTLVSVAGSKIQDKLEELIQSVETTVNEWVDGVDRELLVLTVTPKIYGDLENYIDSIPNPINGVNDEVFHRVKIYPNFRQTVDAICSIDGAAGQLVLSDTYGLDKIPLSNDYALELFYSRGTEAVMPDLIKMFVLNAFAAAKTTENIEIAGDPVEIGLSHAIGAVTATVPEAAAGKLVATIADDNSKVTFEAKTGLTAGSYSVVLKDSKGQTVTIALTAAE